MTPYIGFAEVIHDPGAATLGLLSDIGWDLDLSGGGGGGGCLPTGLTLTQEPCQEDNFGTLLPVIGITFGIDGVCNVQDLCYSVDGGSYSCFDLPSLDFLMYDGDQINLTETTPNAVYTFYFTTADGTSGTFSFNNGNCTDGLGCTNIYADNYDPTATVDDGSCIFTQTICDCAGTEINIEVLTWLGDGFADNGAFQWNDGPFVDFNCETWGYDCGDISGAPSDDPWDVCSGNLPPNNGCEVIGDCLIDNINVYTEGCQNNSEVMYFLFDYTGDCTVSEICADALFSADLFCFPLEDNNLGDGDIWGISNLEPGSWEFYCTLSDGTVSPVGQLDILPCDPAQGCTNPYATNYNSEADVDDGFCTYNETICDCAGTEHTIGVLVWLGDTFSDTGNYNWDEQPVDFNCDTWGYDCGDIEGSPSDDPWGVCSGSLPPNNGCEDAENPSCTDAAACNYDSTAAVDDGSCEYESCAGCTDPEACNFDATATLDDGSCDYETCAGCTDEAALNYDPDATIDDGSCVYDCEYPTLSLSTFCEEGESDVFYIELDIDDLGNGAPYAITNSYNSDSFEVGFNGSVEIGPFPNDEQVLVTITSILFPNCLLTSPLLSDNCTDDSIKENDAAPAIFPNPTSDHVYVQSPVSGRWHTVLYGADGRIVAQTRLQTQAGSNTLWSLPAHLAPGLYTLRLAQNGNVFTERLVIR